MAEDDTDVMKMDDVEEQFPVLAQDQERIQEVMRMNLGEDLEISPFDLERLTVPTGGQTKWPNGDKIIRGAITAWTNCRAYWKDDFSGSQPPDCSSPDGKYGEGDPGGECATCPNAQFKSAPGDSRGQACKAMRRLLFLQPEDWLPLMVTVPPTSLKACRLYLTRLFRKRGRMFYSVITELGLESDKNDQGVEYSTITFDDAEWLDPEATKGMRAYHDAIAPILRKVPVGSDDYAAETAEAAEEGTDGADL